MCGVHPIVGDLRREFGISRGGDGSCRWQHVHDVNTNVESACNKDKDMVAKQV